MESSCAFTLSRCSTTYNKMKKYDWINNIKVNIFFLRICGLWPKGDGNYTYVPYIIYAAVLLIGFPTLHLILQIVNIYFILDDLEAATGSIYVIVVEFLVPLKCYYLVKNIKMLKDLLSILDTDMFQPKNSNHLKAIADNVWMWKMVYWYFMLTTSVFNVFSTLYPILDKSFAEERRLPCLSWYPFDTKDSPYYEITYFYQSFSILVTSAAHVNIDGLVAAINVFTGSQFDILCDHLRNLKNYDIDRALIDCIKHHKEILSYTNKTNNFLNWILFVQFAAGGIAIGLAMFQLTLVGLLSNEFNSLFFYAIAIAGQVFMYCWFANEIAIKSSNLSYAAFESEWIHFPQEVKMKLLFFLKNVQKPIQLSALKLIYVSMDTFMKILKTSWSYFALLRNVSSE